MNEGEPIGFIRLSRGFFDHALWLEQRVYSRAEAWLDLVRSAAWKDTKRLIDGAMIEIPRGGIAASERFLSDRWMWSRTKVRAFLDLLVSENMIERRKDRGVSLLLLCNYDRYNPEKDQGRTTEIPDADQRGTKVEEDKERTPASGARPSSRADRIEEVIAFADRFMPTSTVRSKPDRGFVEWWWDEQEKCGWVDPRSGAPWSSWQHAFTSAWRAHFRNETQRQSRTTYAQNQRPGGGGAGASHAAPLRNRT